MAKQFTTVDASEMDGVDFASYLAEYFSAQGTATGSTTYYGGDYSAGLFGYWSGSQMGVRYAESSNQAQVLVEGIDLQYDGVEGIHGSYSGYVDSVTFGYWDSNTEYLDNGSERSSLIGVLQELKISGLDIFADVGAGTGEDNAFYQLRTLLINATSDEIEPGNTLTNGELALQELYKMFASKAQHFIGSDGDDIYTGTKFGDRIDGGAGFDTLSGGKGKDHFIFDIDDSTLTSDGADIILDFNTKKDRMDFSSIDADTVTAGDQAFKFIGTKDFTGKAGQISYERLDGQTHVYLDVDGDALADMTVTLDGKFKLEANDFLL